MTIDDLRTTIWLIAFGILTIGKVAAQDETAAEYQAELNAYYKDKDHSPLWAKDRKQYRKFKGHIFYPISEKYRVVAKFERTPEAEVFEMKTSGWKTPEYVLYGIASFTLGDSTYTLQLYQNIAYSKEPDYDNSLFLPFADHTNGETTYGGGRYIDIRIPEDPHSIVIDFNKAYNPYCAYTDGWNCPIVPIENRLPRKIEAGIMLKKKL